MQRYSKARKNLTRMGSAATFVRTIFAHNQVREYFGTVADNTLFSEYLMVS